MGHLMISCGGLVSNSREGFSISCADGMKGLYRPQGYNAAMNSAVSAALIHINREFYDQFGDSFSVTRQRLQPGVQKILKDISPEDSVLDLGCGNGHFLKELFHRGHRAPLLGVDFSLPLLRNAVSSPKVEFRELDLTRLSHFTEDLKSPAGLWSVVTMFAVLHHIPSLAIRLEIVQAVKEILKPGGKFILSNWQFHNSEKLKSRIQPWSSAGISETEVDPGDYLLDWRSGGRGLRYAHQFSEQELIDLMEPAGLRLSQSFFSDGDNGRLGLYQIWHTSDS